MKPIDNCEEVTGGAVTVDWVVLTAALVGLAVTALNSIESCLSAIEL